MKSRLCKVNILSANDLSFSPNLRRQIDVSLKVLKGRQIFLKCLNGACVHFRLCRGVSSPKNPTICPYNVARERERD